MFLPLWKYFSLYYHLKNQGSLHHHFHVIFQSGCQFFVVVNWSWLTDLRLALISVWAKVVICDYRLENKVTKGIHPFILWCDNVTSQSHCHGLLEIEGMTLKADRISGNWVLTASHSTVQKPSFYGFCFGALHFFFQFFFQFKKPFQYWIISPSP